MRAFYISCIIFSMAVTESCLAEMLLYKTLDPKKSVMWSSKPEDIRNERLVSYIKGYKRANAPSAAPGTWQIGMLEALEEGKYRLDFGVQCSVDFTVLKLGLHFDGPPRDWLVEQKATLKKGTQHFFSMAFTIEKKDAGRKLRLPAAWIGDLPAGADFTLFNAKLYKDIHIPALRKPELLFSVSFDNGWNAEKAMGDPGPLDAENLVSVPGISGNGVRIARTGARLSYPIKRNLMLDQGTVTFWYKPEWTRRAWYPLFVLNRDWPGEKRQGSNWLWFWIQDGILRADLSDDKDSYKRGGDIISGQWQWLAFRWGPAGVEVFRNGVKAPGGDSESPFKKISSIMHFSNPGSFDRFFVGGGEDGKGAEGIFDELRIYSGMLDDAELQRIFHEANVPRLHLESRYFLPYTEQQSLHFSASPDADWKLVDFRKRTLLSGKTGSGNIDIPLPPLEPGNYTLFVRSRGVENSETLIFFSPSTSFSKSGKLDLEKIDEIRFEKPLDSERFVSHGNIHLGTCEGMVYLETEEIPDARFSIRFQLPDGKTPYYVEWLYPDDKIRNAEIVVHEAKRPDYGLCVGYSIGDEYPNSGKLLKQGGILYPRKSDKPLEYALTLRTPRRMGAPGAIAAIRIYRICDGKLPAARLGNQRALALYYEDPALYASFPYLQNKADSMPEFEEFLARLSSYMKFSGQNMLIYPFVWYQGELGEYYKPRPHALNFYDGLMTFFDRENLSFIGAFNPHNTDCVDAVHLTAAAQEDGRLHDTPVMIYDTGKPNPGRWHGSPPNFNILHPALQKKVMQWVDDLCRIGARHHSFRGIEFTITTHSLLALGNLSAGYNDFMIESFERDTGIQIPIDRKAPLRGKLYADWLLANVRPQWIEWRCRQLEQFYRRVAEKLRAVRSDLVFRINMTLTQPVENDSSTWNDPDFVRKNCLAAGIDPERIALLPNTILTITTQPAIYRYKFHSRAPEKQPYLSALKRYDTTQATFSILSNAPLTAIHLHDKYWESPLGKRDPLKAPWLREIPWRVSTLNPGGIHAMRSYVYPFRWADPIQLSKGGFLIGSYGTEKQLASFAEQFTVLPPRRFKETGKDEIVKIRTLVWQGSLWFYVVNTGDSVRELRLRVPGGTLNAPDGKTPKELQHGVLKLSLAPYSLRSFRCPGGDEKDLILEMQ